MLPLKGVRILDLSRNIPGHYATMVLGDFGAEVLKVEEPPVGGARIAAEKESAYSSMNRNKKSITLNLKKTEARQVFYKLAERSDVILEGFRPGVVKRLGVDYETISKLNSRMIYCSLSGYGQDGPYMDLPGHDINYLATAGALGLIGSAGGPPVVLPPLIGDFAAGSLGMVVGVLLALIAREKTGQGQYIDISMTDGVVALLTMVAEQYFSKGLLPQRGETALGGGYPYKNVYKTKDGKYVAIGCFERSLWENLCRELGREDFAPYYFVQEHPYKKPEGSKWEEIFSYLREVFATKTRDEWFERLSQKNIGISKVYSLDEVFSDPQVIHREMVMELNHPTQELVKQVGFYLKLKGTPAEFRTFAPSPGQHTEEVLGELGYSTEDIERLRREGVIA